jgi:hypothetical protein
MADRLPPLPNDTPPAPPTPVLLAYVLRGSDWVEIGTGYEHDDGKGYRLRLDVAPSG